MAKTVNGIDTVALADAIGKFRHDEALGPFQFRARTRWVEGGANETTIDGFYGAGRENDGRRFTVRADEPPLLLGKDGAPNPVEHLLHALGACMTSSMVYHAAARGIRIEGCTCEISGDLDVRGFLGISGDVRKGFSRIAVRFVVQSDATSEELEQLARYSPVLDVVTHGTDVAISIEANAGARAPEPA
jgi:uncharacterized OsmC-like protein